MRKLRPLSPHNLPLPFLLSLCLTVASATPLRAQAQEANQISTAGAVVLDRVIAIVNGQVLLESDVEEEQKLSVLEPFHNRGQAETLQEAARHLILRTLVLEQMQEQDQPTTVSAKQAEQELTEMRAAMTDCAPENCKSQQGWETFLKQHKMTEAEALERAGQRMAIERFIDLRFRAGIRITREEAQQYYDHTLLPNMRRYEHDHQPPAFATLERRIRQLLLEQRVNVMIEQWLKNLMAQGSVQILVPEYKYWIIPNTGSEPNQNTQQNAPQNPNQSTGQSPNQNGDQNGDQKTGPGTNQTAAPNTGTRSEAQ